MSVIPDLSWVSESQWEAITAPITNGSDNRSAQNYLRVISQFPLGDVVTGLPPHKRYAPLPLLTWCNILGWDVARAMAVHFPHWIRGLETRANDLCLWLEHKLRSGGAMQGPEHGWSPVLELEAVKAAGRGWPTLATWYNHVAQKPGHVAWVLPSNDGTVQIAQAGRTCFSYGPLALGFGTVKPVRFWTHE